MNNKKSLLLLILVLASPVLSASADKTSPASSSTSSSLAEEKKRLELERLELENEKLKFELERMKSRSAEEDKTAPAKADKRNASKEEIRAYQDNASNKSETLAKENKDRIDLIILDFANAEIWHHGVRYNLHELYTLAQDMKWPLKKTLKARDAHGHPRYQYRIRNLSLLRYEGRDRGIVEIESFAREGDFQILTLEGITLDSSIGDVRNSLKSVFLPYDSQGQDGKYKVLKYKHSKGLNFSDKLEIFFDGDGKLAKMRYGVLDEH